MSPLSCGLGGHHLPALIHSSTFNARCSVLLHVTSHTTGFVIGVEGTAALNRAVLGMGGCLQPKVHKKMGGKKNIEGTMMFVLFPRLPAVESQLLCQARLAGGCGCCMDMSLARDAVILNL